MDRQMSRRATARVAGFAFLVYIATAFPGMVLSGRATAGEGIAAKLASIAAHASELRLAILLFMVGNLCALILAVTLHAVTRDEDPVVAMMILVSRTAEGVVGGVSLSAAVGRLWLGTVSGAAAPDAAAKAALGAFLLQTPRGFSEIGGSFFAVGSLCFSCLLLRGRMVPVPLAWIGVIASILVVILLPLQLAGFVSGLVTELMWLPMLAFEVPLGFWLLFKGVAPARHGLIRSA
jgi:hypothetical protein